MKIKPGYYHFRYTKSSPGVVYHVDNNGYIQYYSRTHCDGPKWMRSRYMGDSSEFLAEMKKGYLKRIRSDRVAHFLEVQNVKTKHD